MTGGGGPSRREMLTFSESPMSVLKGIGSPDKGWPQKSLRMQCSPQGSDGTGCPQSCSSGSHLTPRFCSQINLLRKICIKHYTCSSVSLREATLPCPAAPDAILTLQQPKVMSSEISKTVKVTLCNQTHWVWFACQANIM